MLLWLYLRNSKWLVKVWMPGREKVKLFLLSDSPKVVLADCNTRPLFHSAPLHSLCLLFPSFLLLFCLPFLLYPQTRSSLFPLPKWVMSCQNNGLLCFIEPPMSCSPSLCFPPLVQDPSISFSHSSLHLSPSWIRVEWGKLWRGRKVKKNEIKKWRRGRDAWICFNNNNSRLETVDC